jgi:hypothetical protein
MEAFAYLLRNPEMSALLGFTLLALVLTFVAMAE